MQIRGHVFKIFFRIKNYNIISANILKQLLRRNIIKIPIKADRLIKLQQIVTFKECKT